MAKEYKINDCGICTNADKYGTELNHIKVALFPDDKWRFGVLWNSFGKNYAGGGFGCGCGQKHGDIYAYDTERRCLIAGMKYLEGEYEYSSNVLHNDCRDLLSAIERIKMALQPKQLSLF